MDSKKASKALIVAAIVLICAEIAGFSGDAKVCAAEPVRVTTSFDARYAGAVLHQVAHLYGGGFGRSDAERVAHEIDGLKADVPRVWQFTVQYQGHAETLEIRALMDDLGMIDLDFAAGADAAPAVRAAVDGYLNGRGH